MFTTPVFFLYFVIVLFIFFSIRREWRISALACASILFCIYLDLYAGIVLLCSSCVTYAGGHVIEKLKKKDRIKAAKGCTGVLVSLHVVFMVTYKFGSFILARIQGIEQWNAGVMEYLIIPIGFSFYTFQAIAYLVDIYRGNYTPRENVMEFILYMSFFPKLISGPIERAGDFLGRLHQIHTINFWQSGRLSVAFTYMLYGYFMKIVIADRIGVTVNRLFDQPSDYDSLWLLMGMILYTIQIYADFAGYSYIAYGVAKIFGIELQLNFKNPYFSLGITEFWRKWHISLSSWLRDYLYIPLGGNRKGRARKHINTMLVFIVCGLWHGTGLSFLIWGILHGAASVMESLCWSKIRNKLIKRIVMLAEVSIAWVFFRAASTKEAIRYFWQILTQGTSWERVKESFWKLNLNVTECGVIFFSILLLLLMDGWADQRKGVFPEILQKQPQIVRYVLFYMLLILVFVFGIYGSGYQPEKFIYMQF